MPIGILMKIVLTILLTSSLSLYASPHWIQVSSIDSSKSISSSFLKKVKSSGFSHKIFEVNGKKKVRLGAFKSQKEALNALPKIRCKVAYDAFVVTKPLAKPKYIAKQQVVKKEMAAEEVMMTKSLPQVTAIEPCLCIYDPHMLHKMELEDAIAYYKNSTYYSF